MNNPDHFVVISKYSELTAEMMIKLLKSSLNDFEFGFYKKGEVEVPASKDIKDVMNSAFKYMSLESEVLKLADFQSGVCEKHLRKEVIEYYKAEMALICEYINKLEEQGYSVGEIRLANRGLEALMWYRDEGGYGAEDNDLPFEEFLLMDELKDATSQMYDNIVYMVKKANCEKLWIRTDWRDKADFVKKWGYTLMVDPEDTYDEDSAFPYHSQRELKMFEKIMGREFEEFDPILRQGEILNE